MSQHPTTDNERGSWTSASAAEYDLACPGRHIAQRGISEAPPTDSADSGIKIHAWLESDASNRGQFNLSDEEMETAERCLQMGRDFIKGWAGEEHGAFREFRETRLWIDFDGVRHSGKPDFVIVDEDRNRAAVIDWKTGRSEATENPSNLQLRDNAVLVARNFGVSEVTVKIIQPWAKDNPPCVYTAGDLVTAMEQLEARIVASNDPKSPRVPGEIQCRYCRARATCPEFLAQSLPVKPEVSTPEVLEASVKSLASDRLGAFLAMVRLAEETATEEVRKRIDAGEAVAGWVLKPGRESEKIVDAVKVFNRALAAGVTQEAFVSECITVGKTALKGALKAATGAKGKALEAKLEELLDGATETKVSSPVLTRASE